MFTFLLPLHLHSQDWKRKEGRERKRTREGEALSWNAGDQNGWLEQRRDPGLALEEAVRMDWLTGHGLYGGCQYDVRGVGGNGRRASLP